MRLELRALCLLNWHSDADLSHQPLLFCLHRWLNLNASWVYCCMPGGRLELELCLNPWFNTMFVCFFGALCVVPVCGHVEARRQPCSSDTIHLDIFFFLSEDSSLAWSSVIKQGRLAPEPPGSACLHISALGSLCLPLLSYFHLDSGDQISFSCLQS